METASLFDKIKATLLNAFPIYFIGFALYHSWMEYGINNGKFGLNILMAFVAIALFIYQVKKVKANGFYWINQLARGKDEKQSSGSMWILIIIGIILVCLNIAVALFS